MFIDKIIIVRNKSGYIAQIGVKWYNETNDSSEERTTISALRTKTFLLPKSKEVILFGNAVFGTPAAHMIDLIRVEDVKVCVDLYG